MDSNQWAFNRGERVPKDGKWFTGYLATMGVTAVVGILAWWNANPLFHRATWDARYMNNHGNCDVGSAGRRHLLADDTDLLEAYWRVAARAILGSLIPALVAGFVLIQLFRKYPHGMVIFGLSMPMVLFCVLAGLMAWAGLAILVPIFLIPAAVLLVIVIRYRSQVTLVGRLIKVASDSLAANPALVPFALGANFVVIPPIIAIGAVLYFLQGNGVVVRNPAATGASWNLNICKDENDEEVHCCTWRTDRWVLPVQITVAIVMLWTDSLAAQLRTYVMGGVITQWYFHEETRGTIPRSLQHALGPARGTLCFSAAVVTVCNLIRAAADRIRNNRAHPVYLILSCLFSWLLDMLQELIRFVSNLATIQAAATGEAFLDAARSVGSMLTRHSLSAVTVWWMPNMVLSSTLLGVTMAAGTAAYFIAGAMWDDTQRHNPEMDALALAFMVAYTFLLLTGWLLGFIRSATDVVYVCFARDLDNRAVTRPDVHAVLKDVPSAAGAVVVQPDNNMMYGAMEEGESDSPTAPLNGPPAPPERDLTAAIEAQAPPRKDEM
eukprot:jgi/Ulvmu1/580/UM001_0588.1